MNISNIKKRSLLPDHPGLVQMSRAMRALVLKYSATAILQNNLNIKANIPFSSLKLTCELSYLEFPGILKIKVVRTIPYTLQCTIERD